MPIELKEARIIFSIDRQLNVIQVAVNALVKAFGGVTSFEGRGIWTAPSGQPILEKVLLADIAYEGSEENDAKLYDIAWKFREDAKQVEVYVRYGNGHVQMVTERSCMDNGGFDYHKFIQEVKGWEDLEKETVSDVMFNDAHVEI